MVAIWSQAEDGLPFDDWITYVWKNSHYFEMGSWDEN